MQLLKDQKPKLMWDSTFAEHSFMYKDKGKNHVVYYPTLKVFTKFFFLFSSLLFSLFFCFLLLFLSFLSFFLSFIFVLYIFSLYLFYKLVCA